MDIYWLEQSEDDVPPHHGWLSSRERAKLHELRFPKRRAEWLLGRWTAKQAVAAYLAWPAQAEVLADIEVRPAPSGAPEIFIGNQPVHLSFSLSHRSCKGLCSIAAPGRNLGCDLEVIEPRSPAFVNDYFTVDEQELIAISRAADRWRMTALLWSAKESALKALHQGLRLDTRSVAVGLDSSDHPCAWRRLQVATDNGQIFYGWWMQTGQFVRTVVSDRSSQPPFQLATAVADDENAAARGSRYENRDEYVFA